MIYEKYKETYIKDIWKMQRKIWKIYEIYERYERYMWYMRDMKDNDKDMKEW